jgi:hypothetical protein
MRYVQQQINSYMSTLEDALKQLHIGQDDRDVQYKVDQENQANMLKCWVDASERFKLTTDCKDVVPIKVLYTLMSRWTRKSYSQCVSVTPLIFKLFISQHLRDRISNDGQFVLRCRV